MLKKSEEGEQAYVVSPLIEESEAFDYQNAVDLYEQLRAYFPPHIQYWLITRKIQQEEKESMMKQFMKNEIQIFSSDDSDRSRGKRTECDNDGHL